MASSKQRHIAWAKTTRAAGQWKPAIQAYLVSTAMTDDLFGQMVGALEKSKYADNTIIVLWSDHGFQFGEKERWAIPKYWNAGAALRLIRPTETEHKEIPTHHEPIGALQGPFDRKRKVR